MCITKLNGSPIIFIFIEKWLYLFVFKYKIIYYENKKQLLEQYHKYIKTQKKKSAKGGFLQARSRLKLKRTIETPTPISISQPLDHPKISYIAVTWSTKWSETRQKNNTISHEKITPSRIRAHDLMN